jgi:hypothetical protein
VRVEEDMTMEEMVEEIVEENTTEAEREEDDIMESGDEYHSADDKAAWMAVNACSFNLTMASRQNLDAANDLSPAADTPRVTVSE